MKSIIVSLSQLERILKNTKLDPDNELLTSVKVLSESFAYSDINKIYNDFLNNSKGFEVLAKVEVIFGEEKKIKLTVIRDGY